MLAARTGQRSSDAREAAVAGILGAALLGAAAAAAPVSGSAMGAAMAGALFTALACAMKGRGGCRGFMASTLTLLGGIAMLQVAGLGEGLAPSVWGRGALLPPWLAGPAAGALLAGGLAARETPSIYPGWARGVLAAAAGLLAAAGAVEPLLTAIAGLAAGTYLLGEMVGWAAVGLQAGS